MSEKNYIDLRVLENADDDMLNGMSSKYDPLDEGEINRIFAKSKRKYNARKNCSDFSSEDEITGVDVYITQKMNISQRLLKISGNIAVCISIISIGLILLKSMKAPLANNNNPPVSLSETTALSTVISDNEIYEQVKAANTTSTTSNAIPEASVKKTEDENILTYDNDDTPMEIASGEHSTDDLRLNYDKIMQIAEKSDNIEDFANEIIKIKPIPDRISAGGTIFEYWCNDEGTEVLLSENNKKFTFSDINTHTTKEIFIAGEIRKIEQFKEKEADLGCYLIRERINILRHNYDPVKRYTLEEYKKFGEESKDFAEFWKRLNYANSLVYPEKWSENEPMIFIYTLSEEDGYIIVDIDNAYAKYFNDDATDKSIEIINNKGSLDNNSIQLSIEKMKTFNDYTDMEMNSITGST